METVTALSAVMDNWQAALGARLKRSTTAAYAGVADCHIRPILGAEPAGKISDSDAARIIGGMNDVGLAPSTVRLCASVLQSILDYRVKCDISAPAVHVERPTTARREARVLSVVEQRALEYYIAQNTGTAELGVLICLYTGLREGEICALQWGDVDFGTGVLSVRRTVQRVRSAAGTELILGEPKSKSSRRTIPLPQKLLAVMRAMAGKSTCYVVTGSEKPMEPRTMQYKFKRMLRAAGVADANFHALRHSFATKCIDKGFDPKTLSEILGHADVSTTLNIYVHPSVERMRRCMDLLED